ncbi:PKD domain-containing protein [Robertkochia flava]|uniref:PKD domain-containing protein n=1 Tax=Robertkochia flava TaxID=3447986 RepID=UPI00293D4A79|nr:PKD domain-containing protein [Robertkochia marina]
MNRILRFPFQWISGGLYCNWIPLLLAVLVVLISTGVVTGQTISFGQTGLQGESIVNPTSLSFGPNGKLYVSQQNGTLWEFTVARDTSAPGSGNYSVVESKTITLIKNATPNHNDDGTQNTTSIRQITGILATGTPENPILYVTSSDWRIGGGGSLGNDTNLDTNSGILSRLKWNGQQWEKVDLVRGLPRCEENHSTNGMDIFSSNGQDYLLVQQGGNTNMGAPSNNFAGSSEFFLAGALLIVNLSQIQEMESSNGGPFTDPRTGTAYIYDLPTLNDPERPDITNASPSFPYGPQHPMYNATIDLGDPFGGNNGLNQAFPEPGGPVQIFAPGFRNAYDVVVTSSGKIYTSDNGPNKGWGGPPAIYDNTGTLKGDDSNTTYNSQQGDYVTNQFNITNGVSHGDQLHLIGNITDGNGTYYGGHPVPVRAFPDKAGIYKYSYDGSTWIEQGSYAFADLLSGVSGYLNQSFTLADFPSDPRQGDYTTDDINDPSLNILDIVNSSTNGISEYTATNFGGAMTGDLITASFNGSINRYKTDATGSGLILKNNAFLSGFGSQPLDVVALGDNAIFPGTIWAVTYGADNVTIFEPADFGNCIQPEDPEYDASLDYDNDGFTNGDEIANGTNPCSAGSQPTDNDNDKISDLSDPDDDNDGIPDLEDAFAIDPQNGLSTSLPLSYPFWNNDPGTGFFGLGFTGLMLDPTGNTDYLDQFDETNISFGGAAGKATVDQVDDGEALQGVNNQKYAFQFGVAADTSSPPFTIQTAIETPFDGFPPQPGQEYGIYIGTGDQDNYFKMVLDDGADPNDDTYGITLLLEEGGTVISSQNFDVAGLISANAVTFYLSIDPAQNTVNSYYSLDGGGVIMPLGLPVTLPASFLDPSDAQGMAVGIISTSGGAGTYTATWDYLNITLDEPGVLQANSQTFSFGTLAINGEANSLSLEVTNQGGATDQAITISDLIFSGPDSTLFSTNAVLPLQVGPGETKIIPVTLTPDDTARLVSAQLDVVHDGANSPLQVTLEGELTDILNTTVIRINSGGAAENYEGKAFAADQYFSSGKVYSNTKALVSPLLSTERTASSPPQLFYNIPVENGTYEVNLYFSEIYWGATGGGNGGVGSRVFDVIVEGDLVLDNFDIFAEVGAETLVVKSYNVTVTDGEISLLFDASSAVGGVNQPKISAIEIFSASNQVPIAKIGASVTSGNAPLTVNFTGEDSLDDDGIVSYEWDFGDGSTSSEANPSHIYLSEGTFTVSLTVMDSRGATNAVTTEIQVGPSQSNDGYKLLLNAGGGSVTYEGKVFQQDEYFTGGKTYTNPDALVPELLKTERSASPPEFSYQIPVVNGTYQVILHFAEIYWGATGGGSGGVGKRVFDVFLEGNIVLDNYDIYADVGAETIASKSFTTEVTDQNLDLYFSALAANGGVNQPKISAIEIYGIDNGQFSPITITSIPEQVNKPGDLADITVAAVGGDPAKAFMYSLTGQPEGILIDSLSGKISGEISQNALTGGPASDGIHQVVVTVNKEGSQPSEENFQWTVSNGPEAVASADTLSGPAPFQVAFSGLNSSSVNGVISGYEWDFGDGVSSTEANPTHVYTSNGSYAAVLTVTDELGLTDSDTMNVNVAPVSGAFELRINAGGVQLDYEGNTFFGDQGFTGGYVYTNASALVPELLKSERTAGSQLGYNIAVPNGEYTVNLYFAEIYWGATGGGSGGVGSRVFDVSLENTLVLDNFDIIAEAGAAETLVVKSFNVTVSDGQLNLFFDSSSAAGGVNQPKISAIEILSNVADPITLSQILNQVNKVGDQIDIAVEASGGDPQQNFNYSISGQPEGVDIEPTNGQIFGVVSENALTGGPAGDGVHNVTVSVTKSGSQPVDEVFQWIISNGPVAVAEADTLSGVVPLEINFSGSNSTAGLGSVQTYSWDFGDGVTDSIADPLHTYQASGIYTAVLTVTDSVGLSDTDSLEITVTDPLVGPTALAAADVQSGEAPLEVNFTGSGSTSGGQPITAYSWDFGDGVTDSIADPLHTYQASGIYTAVLTVTDSVGLSDTDSLEITVTDPLVGPTALAAADVQSGEAPLEVNFTGSSSTSGGQPITAYSWDFGDGVTDSIADPLHTYQASGIYTAILTVTDSVGLSDTDSLEITVTDPLVGPTALAAADVQSGEAPLEVTFTGSGSTSGGQPITAYSWDFGDGVTDSIADPLHTYQASGIYTAVLTVTDSVGLSDTDSLEITVTDPLVGPTALAAADVQSGEAPLEVTFTGSGSTSGGQPITAYSWDFGDGVTDSIADPLHIYQASGIYTAVLTVTDSVGLSDTDSLEITVTDPLVGPTALAAADVQSGEAPLEVTFSGSSSTSGGQPITAYSWDFGDGVTDSIADPLHTYQASGIYTAVLTVTDSVGLSDTDSLEITVTDPLVGPTALAAADVQSGEAPLEVTFSGSSSTSGGQPITAYSWDFGDGVTDSIADPLHTYQVSGIYTAVLTVTDSLGLSDTDSLEITVTDPLVGPTALAAVDVQSGEAPLEVNFTGSGSTSGGQPITAYSWDFGDGVTDSIADPLHTYQASGIYTAVLTVTDSVGLSDTDSLEITVTDPLVGPTALASADVQSGEAPLEVTFSGSGSTSGGQPITAYSWDFGDGVTDSIADPLHTYQASGIYTAVLTVTDSLGLSDTDSLEITVTDPLVGPTAVVVSDVKSGEAPLEVSFSGSGSLPGTNPIISYNWDFGDGISDTLPDPVHIYEATGMFTAVLTVTDSIGLSDSNFVKVRVTEPGLTSEVVSFTLVNADTDTDLFELVDGSVIDLSTLGGAGLNIRANTAPAEVGKVIFELLGPNATTSTQQKIPYALFGTKNSDYRSGILSPGTHTLTATPYETGGNAPPGLALTVNFSVVNVQTKSGSEADLNSLTSNSITSGMIVMYPNPANSLVHISGLNPPSVSGNTIFHIHDLKGSLVKSLNGTDWYRNSEYQLPVDDLQQGIYILSLENGGDLYFSQRLVIKK